jgi:tripartite-type tricarboxylate transporter receptor subunit TctC
MMARKDDVMTRFVATIALTAASVSLAWAQTFPTKPVRMIVPFTAGGASDILARLVSTGLRNVWGQAPIVENRAGAGGSIGADAVAKATPDGHTLMVTDLGTMTILPSLVSNLPYDLHKDLAAVTVISFSPYLVAVTPKLPVKSINELLDYSKASPGKLNVATPGLGSIRDGRAADCQ